MFSTVQKVRERAGLQNYRIDAPLQATGNSTIWNVPSKDLERFVPLQDTGASVPSITDVTAKYSGLSIGISAIDVLSGAITFTAGYVSGSSIVATYASSPIRGTKVIQYMQEANNTVLSYLSAQYTLPLGSSSPILADLEAKIAAGNLLINSYGVSAEDLAEDGYKMVESAMEMLLAISDGKIDLIDESGTPIAKNTSNLSGGGNALGGSGVRVPGYLFTADQEKFKVVKRSEYVQNNI